MTGPPVLDHGAIDKLRGFGGVRLIRGMIELFTTKAPGKVAEAREALDAGDAAGVRSALHSLKSSSAQLGCMSVYQSCVAGEDLASRGDLSGCAVHLTRIEADLPEACRQLKAAMPPQTA